MNDCGTRWNFFVYKNELSEGTSFLGHIFMLKIVVRIFEIVVGGRFELYPNRLLGTLGK